MNAHKWLRLFRWLGGFLLAPAIVPLTLYAAVQIGVARLDHDLSTITANALAQFVLIFGVGLVYLSMLCFGIPYVVLFQRAGRLSFRTIMVPVLLLSWVYSVVIYGGLHGVYPFAGTVALVCVPAVILTGLCFYFIVLWRAPIDETEISLLLETYPRYQPPTLQT
jgi:hypothetical protein